MSWRGVLAVVLVAGCAVVGAGCFAPRDAIREELIGPYALLAVDSREQLKVVYDTGSGLLVHRIGPVVVDAGFDERYVVTACRPEGKPGGDLSYYYIDIAMDTPSSRYEAVNGPFSGEEFEDAKAVLDLPEFTLHYPELR
jgi:hypothetical protein